MRQHLLEDIRSHALAKPNQFAVCDSQVSINYGALDRFSTSLAMHLQAIGCKTGSRVVVVANRRAIIVAAILGTFKAGCIHVPLDPRMPAARLQYILNDIAPAAVITGAGVKVINAYGPTEVTCGCTAYTIRDLEPGRQELYPIGRPFKHVRTFLVGSEGERIT